jgi:hypothetical protein
MSTELTLEEKATNADTSQHIRTVQKFIHLFVKNMLDRADAHDQSKLAPPEVAGFTEFTSKLKGTTYGSPEYKEFLKELGPALAHHYAKNDHHPEHFKPSEPDQLLIADMQALENCHGLPEQVKQRLLINLGNQLEVYASSVCQMNLVQLVEMFCDWKAATLRHDDGNLRKSIEHNAGRFGMSRQLRLIFENTAALVDGVT